MDRLSISERKLAEALYVPDEEYGVGLQRDGKPHRVPIQRAIALYNIFGAWSRVARALGFTEIGVRTAVRKHDRRL
ncbi:MAG TPA: hypothetical protein VN325_23255 [Steroidobacteraceae bacterium]|nr:hypothetical protein [Steroidobacteraceae bacterium]